MLAQAPPPLMINHLTTILVNGVAKRAKPRPLFFTAQFIERECSVHACTALGKSGILRAQGNEQFRHIKA